MYTRHESSYHERKETFSTEIKPTISIFILLKKFETRLSLSTPLRQHPHIRLQSSLHDDNSLQPSSYDHVNNSVQPAILCKSDLHDDNTSLWQENVLRRPTISPPTCSSRTSQGTPSKADNLHAQDQAKGQQHQGTVTKTL